MIRWESGRKVGDSVWGRVKRERGGGGEREGQQKKFPSLKHLFIWSRRFPFLAENSRTSLYQYCMDSTIAR